MIMLPKGIKKQVLGGVLFCLGMTAALLARILGFELDMYYVVIGMIGAGLFLYGAIQKNRHADGLCTKPDVAIGVQPNSMDFTARTNLASRRPR